jgi:hypothetical protein
MAEIVNLNQYRKKKAQAEKKAKAARNRVKEGRSKSARTADQLARERGEKALDGTKVEPREDD